MGFYSWDCKHCGDSIKAPYGLPRALSWQNRVHALGPDGDKFVGAYDGYGRVITRSGEANLHDPVEVWHEHCYRDAGQPEYSEPSKWSGDQGYFYERPEQMEQR